MLGNTEIPHCIIVIFGRRFGSMFYLTAAKIPYAVYLTDC